MLHRSLAIICIFSFVCLSLSEKTEPVALSWAGQLPYQAHSFNDLNITRHLLQKGVKYFKFDVSAADRTSCKTQSTWDSKLGCFNSSYYVEQICCLSMRGDAGSQYNFQHPFNTSSDFVQLFEEFLSSATERKGIIFAAINFQFTFEMSNPIVEEFLYQLALLSKRYKNLYFSPSDNYILEYDRLCRHSPSKEQQKISSNIQNFIGSDEVCTERRKTISESPMVLQSGSNHPSDVRDYKGRFRNFNTYYKEVDRLCREGFPTWANKYPQFPFIFWQPSNQDQIQYVYKKLFSPSCVKLHNRTLSGIAFASNIDPQMFAAYLRPTSILPSPFPWNLMSKAWLQNVSSFKMATIRVAQSQSLIASWKTEDTGSFLGSFILDEKNNVLKLDKVIQLTKSTIELHAVGSSIIVILGEQGGESRYADVTAVSFSPALQRLKERSISSYIASYSSKEAIYYMSRTSSQDYFNLYVMTPDLSNSTQYGVSQNLPKEQMDTLTAMYFRKGLTLADDVFLLFKDKMQQTQIIQMKNGDRHKIKTLTFGTRASIADRDDGSLLISLEGSYSHGGILLNNNAQYKCGLHKLQASERLAHLPQLVDVLEAKIENILQFLQSDSSQIITACDPRFVLSKQINGKNVKLAHLWGRLFISSQYIHLTSQDLMISLFSGGSNYESELRSKKGFILVSFPNQASASLNKQIVTEQ